MVKIDWTEPAETPPNLTGSDVHVWAIDLDRPDTTADLLTGMLDTDEQARAARLKSDGHRERFVVSHAALRHLLARYAGTNPAVVRFMYGEKGKPHLAGAIASSGIQFNLSHSGPMALIAITRGRRVGADVEPLDRGTGNMHSIAERFFSPAEQDAILRRPAEDQPREFLRTWTRKEAFIKALGEGLFLPLDGFDTTVTPDGTRRRMMFRDREGVSSEWMIEDLSPGQKFAAAIAVECVGESAIRTQGMRFRFPAGASSATSPISSGNP